MSELELVDPWVDWGVSGGVLRMAGQDVPFRVPLMGYRELDDAVVAMQRILDTGSPLAQAIAEVTARPVHRHRLEVHRLSEEIIVIDDTDSRGAADAVESVKTISMISARQRRVVVVAGPIDFADESDYDSLDAFGAFMVRLNINQVFAVGPMARALFLSVGREGSWDGESQHCVDVATAYDEVRAFVRPKDVVLVMGTTAESLLPIVEKLVEDFR